MEDEILEEQESSTETPEEETQENSSEDENSEEEPTAEQIAEWKQKAEQSSKNFERAKKAEAEVKKLKGSSKSEKKDDQALSSTDLFALINNNIKNEDDVDWLTKQAKVYDKSIPELLKSDEIKQMLQFRGEQRKTADATNTGSSRPTTKKMSGEDIERSLKEDGTVPERGSQEAEELFFARRGGRRE